MPFKRGTTPSIPDFGGPRKSAFGSGHCCFYRSGERIGCSEVKILDLIEYQKSPWIRFQGDFVFRIKRNLLLRCHFYFFDIFSFQIYKK